jgi:hypothetical protein
LTFYLISNEWVLFLVAKGDTKVKVEKWNVYRLTSTLEVMLLQFCKPIVWYIDGICFWRVLSWLLIANFQNFFSIVIAPLWNNSIYNVPEPLFVRIPSLIKLVNWEILANFLIVLYLRPNVFNAVLIPTFVYRSSSDLIQPETFLRIFKDCLYERKPAILKLRQPYLDYMGEFWGSIQLYTYATLSCTCANPSWFLVCYQYCSFLL